MARTDTQTSEETTAKIIQMRHVVGLTVAKLYSRWQDEKDYEDIADYGKVIEAKLPEGFVFISMSKRPFGFRFILDNKTFHMTCNGRAFSFKRIA